MSIERNLRAAVATQPLHVRQHRSPIRTPQLTVLQPPQHRIDPPVAALIVLGSPKLQRLGPLQHLPHLFHGAHLRLVHIDHHRFDDRHAAPAAARKPLNRPSQAVQAHSSLESRARLQAHTSLDKTVD
ncbi:MAG: hypothetical protein IT503_00090 [Burkholderiaceae bacterium]|nr:hypothetical protein [Ideonella sp.]MCC7284554.1 hypothetical protein [Burkholderiaceae bacterium]